MKVGIVDVGSNTVRLLVARRDGATLLSIREEREHLFLGEDVERDGRLSAERIAETARCVEGYTRIARGAGVGATEVIVTAPGRQRVRTAPSSSGSSRPRGGAGSHPQRGRGGRLAFLGAVAASLSLPGSVAVCDVGGGSAEAVVGTAEGVPPGRAPSTSAPCG